MDTRRLAREIQQFVEKLFGLVFVESRNAVGMSAHSIWPRDVGTTWAEKMEALADTGIYELSVCQPSLPRMISMAGSPERVSMPLSEAWL